VKAITTKYHGPTNTRGSRVSASDEDGNKVSIPYPHELSGEPVHRAAADALLKKMKWDGQLVGGSTSNGYVFVFATPGWSACCRASNRIADLVCAMYHPGDKVARKVFPTATWAEIIASELDVEIPENEVSL
jgi:hypothetical protein